jgi:hypothetical protein
MKTKILRNIFISAGVLFALARPLAADTFITFDPPGSTSTFTLGINPARVIAGDYLDSNNVFHGYVRDANGIITTFDGPGSQLTQAFGINPMGTIRELTLTRISHFTASCALPTVLSPRSIPQTLSF